MKVLDGKSEINKRERSRAGNTSFGHLGGANCSTNCSQRWGVHAGLTVGSLEVYTHVFWRERIINNGMTPPTPELPIGRDQSTC